MVDRLAARTRPVSRAAWGSQPALFRAPLLCLTLAVCAGLAAGADTSDQEEIRRLDRELQRLSSSERGVLGELDRLEALARLREAEAAALERQLGLLEAELAAGEERIAGLVARGTSARTQLRERLRALYRLGGLRHYRLMLGASDLEGMLRASRHATAIAVSDATLVKRVRDGLAEIETARSELLARRQELLEARAGALRARREIEQTRARKLALLETIRQDRQARSGAIEELRRAGAAIGSLAEGAGRDGAPLQGMDFARFRGLLPWPAAGKVASGFGREVHPRFQTEVPHDGLDIAAPMGADIRAVFDGRVVFAGWFSGYGLTLLVDHGGGYTSVYAHASAIVVEKGERVRRGQLLGQVGDSGSLEGPRLYFEIRRDGRPVDPQLWLRKQ